ncbi:hypothetical protein TMPK1_06780 [Rhodospirillales bacterium TMPK1]|uniref:Uncharacterized protein n=1 Tax=Roseiterribacter gracilis TaxID=2812848 RepID=A0A8S8X963_9PROT|nr:hypothetical protein TMPK1_06780 [Rhodospirillales bacterium TMPK1]
MGAKGKLDTRSAAPGLARASTRLVTNAQHRRFWADLVMAEQSVQTPNYCPGGGPGGRPNASGATSAPFEPAATTWYSALPIGL